MKDLRNLPSWDQLKKFKVVKSYKTPHGGLVELLSFEDWKRYAILMRGKGHQIDIISPDVAQRFISKTCYETYRSTNIRMFDQAHDGTLSQDAIQCLGQIGDNDI